MRFQVTLRLFLLAFMLAKVKTKQYAHPNPVPPKYCLECEEEVWEEIPCEQIETTTLAPPTTTTLIPPTTLITTLPPTTTTTTTPPTTTAPATTTIMPTTTTEQTTTTTTTTALPPVTRYRKPYVPVLPSRRPQIYAAKRYPVTPSRPPITSSTTVAPSTTPSIESSDGYKKCYCECKSGCKEFCRKVVVYPDAKKQITQLSKTTQPLEYGQVEVKHLLERNWIPSPPAYSPNSIPIQPIPYYPHSHQLPETPSALPQLPTHPVYMEGNSIPAAPSYVASPYDNTRYPQHNIEADSLGFSIEELTKLLHSDHAFENMIPELSQPPSEYQNLYASPLHPLNPAENPYQYSAPIGIDVGSAAALASVGDDYKASYAKSYEKAEDLSPYHAVKPPAIEPELQAPLPQPAPSPCAQKYEDSSSLENNIPAEDASLDNYLKDLMYSQQPKARGYGYSLSF